MIDAVLDRVFGFLGERGERGAGTTNSSLRFRAVFQGREIRTNQVVSNNPLLHTVVHCLLAAVALSKLLVEV
eukprot:12902423-Prorocentrum_lima.AAC.1